MEILFLMLPGCLLLALIMLGFFVWASKNGQFEDLEGAKHRILYDDDPTP